MKEIRLNIPDGAIKVTVEIGEDGTTVARYEKPEVKVEEQKFEPKDGDISVSDMNSIFIFDGNGTYKTSLYFALFKSGDTTYSGALNGDDTEGYRYATESEKQRLFDALAKEGKRWNAEKKCIEDLPRWRAKANETYYSIGIDVEVIENKEYGGSEDDACYSAGNYFKTREAAERVAKQIREIFKDSKPE